MATVTSRAFVHAGGRRREARIPYGSTDELGYDAEEDPVAVPDFHDTMLLLRMDHKRMTVKLQGLDAHLTGIAGSVVHHILA